ncbi:hypothetical protein B5F37_08050 [Drancourtella sp. An210]|nr:hypothetical protein B5F37_08050 [Drancourtella sp. An210]
MRFKFMILTGFYLVFCIFDICFSNIPVLDARSVGYITENDIFMSLHDSANGYNGILKMTIVYTMPVLLGIYFVKEKETSYWMIRQKTRTRFKQIEVLKVILVSVIFAVIHQVIDMAFTMWCFPKLLLREYSFAAYTIIFAIFACVFYIQTGLIYQIFHDKFKMEISSLLGTFVINFLQYIIIKYYITNVWIPAKDLMIAFEYSCGNIMLSSVAFTISRGVLLAAALYIISQIIFEKKDIMKNEK